MNVRRMNTMERISKYFVQGVHSFSGPFHPFGGAVDIIVVQQQEGSLKSSPWNVTFGKFQGVLKTKENVVNISVNGTEAGFHMYLDQKGQAYFLNEVDGEEGDSVYTATSSGDETVGQSQRGRLIKSKSCNFEVDQPDHGAQVDMSSRKIVKQTNSSRSRISGLVFGQKSFADDYREGEGNGPVMERVNSLERAEIAADLLEMRWSTNLSTDKHRKDRASRLSAPNSSVKKADKDLLLDDKQIQVSPLGGNNLYTSSDHPALHKETGSPVREMGNKSEHGKEFSEYLVDLTRSEVSRPSSEEQVFMLSTSEAMDIEDNQGVSFEISGGMGEIGVENASIVEMTEGVTSGSKVILPNSHGPDLAAIEEIASNMTNTALPSDETGVPFSRFGVSREDCGNKGVQSYIYCKTSESSREGVDDTSKRAFEALNLSQSSDLNALEERASTMTNTALASDEREGIFSRPGVYTEESAKERVGSLVHCETSECSRVGMDGTNEKAFETLSYSCEGCEELQVHAESPYMTTDLISEVNSQKESGFIIAREVLSDSRVLNDENSCKYPNTKTICQCDGTSGYPITKNVVEESLSLPDTHLVSSNSVEDDTKEVVSHDSVTEMLIQEENLETKLVGGFENQYHTKDLFFACISQNSEVELEKPCTLLEPIVQMVHSGQSSGSVEVAESQKICRHSGLYNSSYSVQDQEIQVEEENKMEIIIDPPESGIDFALSDRILIVPSQSLDGNRCHSNDIDDFVSDRFQCQDSFPLNAIDTDSHPSVSLGGIEDGNVSVKINLDPSLSSDMVAQECPLNGFEDLNEDSIVISSPIDIPICAMGVGNGVERMVKSLPNFRSHIDNLEKSDFLHPLSHSLDSNPESLNWVLPMKDVTISLKSDEESKHQLLQGQPRMEDIQMLEELKNASSNHAVEISLCKHLLYEGMGTDAALQAFAAEKVDLEKFSSLGPMLLKNNELVVRIRGFYLPWDAAAPHILGMVAFGLEHIFQPIGMIPVDHVKTTLEGDSSRAIVASNGTWKLWPFSSRRSRNVSSGLPPLSGRIGSSDAANASQSTHEMTKDKDTINAKTTKKKVQSLVPTSEQLASLNLKEGRNIVTFTFSTSMLGKQQVDARIYLWKWNTRIVVSDVDGTITKSDVLGQFMPLVGKDWSQTGVAHLFSAIKENGYQFLFLSARAISQADLTRQFLSNIKQDGKVLPDGPVLISPDGLFPSLYREVIRRAPHEFKIACLMEIRALFPPDCNPFYAGFGNRHTDEISYLKVEIPKGKIFIINPKGEVAVNRWVDTKSYASLHNLVNGMFPPKSSEGQEDFNQWNYWKIPLPDIDI